MAFNKESLIQEKRLELNQLLRDRKFIKGLGQMGFFPGVKLTDLTIDQLMNDVDSILRNCMYDRSQYCRLVETLLYENHNELALKLDPSVIDMYDLNRCDPKLPYINQFSFLTDDEAQSYEINDKCDLKWKEKFNSNTAGTVYPMNKFAESFGFCLLINNFFTRGTYKEMQKFRNIFYQLNFDVIMEKNLTAQEIIDKLIQISQDERLKYHSAFVFMIITHGNADRTIEGFDGERVHIDSLVSIMKNKNCKDLAGKPKIFFLNACRTDEQINLDWGVLAENSIQQLNNISQESTSQMKLVSGEVDNLICFTTIQGFPAFVNRVSGTRFGSALIKELMRSAWHYDLEKILKRVLNTLNETPPDRPSNETIINWTQNSTDIDEIKPILQQYSFPVFSTEGTLPKHLFFNFKEKRPFVLKL